MLKKTITSVSILLCASIAWGSQAATDLSTEYVEKVTAHLDGLQTQLTKVETAEEEATQARRAARAATEKLSSVQKDLAEANDNTSAYPRRIKRDSESAASKREESKSIFERHFPDFDSPEEAIRSVVRRQNRLQDEKSSLEARLSRVESEFSSSLSRARSDEDSARTDLRRNQQDLDNLDTRIPSARDKLRDARQAFRKARELRDDPSLPRKIQKAKDEFAEIDRVRQERGKTCNGLSVITSGVCRKYKAARDKVRRLENIRKPGALRPLRQRRDQAKEDLDELLDEQRDLEINTDELEDDLRRAENRVSDLEDDLRRETRPLRNDIADIDDQLKRQSTKFARAKKLETLEDEIASLKKRVQRNQERLEALPALITKLEGDVATAQTESDEAAEISVDLAQEFELQKAVLPNQKAEIAQLRTDMNNSLASAADLAPAEETAPSTDNEIMTSTDWSVFTTDLDSEWDRATCRAETLEVLEEADSEEISSAQLKVVNLANPKSGFNEPVVVMTIKSSRAADLAGFNTATVRLSSRRSYTFDLIYSKSTEGKLFFMAGLDDREGLIKFMLDKSRMKVTVSNLNPEVDSNDIRFSLKGSTKALNSRSSRDQSMRNACGGIKITDI